MAKTFYTEVELKHPSGLDQAISFHTPEAYQQAHAHKDIHSFSTLPDVGNSEVFIPWEKVGYIRFFVEETESSATEDAFCGGEA